MKRKAGNLTLLMIVMILFAACSTGNGVNTKKPEKTGITAPIEEKSVDIIMAFPAFAAKPKDLPLVEEKVNEIALRKINANVKITPISFSNWNQQINLMLAGKEKLDLMYAFGINFSGFVANNQLIPLDDLLQKYGHGITSFFQPDILQVGKIDGISYGIPTFRDHAQSMGITMRKDLVDKYHIDVNKVKTLDDVEAVLKTMKQNEPALAPLTPVTGLHSILDSYLTYDRLDDGLGVLQNQGANLKVVNWYETQEYENLVKKMRSWYLAGYILKDAATNKLNAEELVKANRAFSFTAKMNPGYDQQESELCGTPMVSATLIEAATSTSVVQAIQWTIPHNSTNPDKAMQFLNLMYTDKDIENLLAWGIEGKHYVIGENGLIDYPAGVDIKNTGYGLRMGWAMGNESLTYVWKGNPPDLWKRFEEFNKSGVKSKAFGFVYNSSNVKTETAAVTNVVSQYKLGLEDGVLDPGKNLPEFISKLKAAGIDKIVAEKQRQINEWAKAKK